MFSGFIREIDSVGRVVIPMQIRRELGIVNPGSKVEMFSDGKQILVKKAVPDCIFCKSSEQKLHREAQGSRIIQYLSTRRAFSLGGDFFSPE